MPSNGSDFWLKGKVKKSLPQKIKNIFLEILAEIRFSAQNEVHLWNINRLMSVHDKISWMQTHSQYKSGMIWIAIIFWQFKCANLKKHIVTRKWTYYDLKRILWIWKFRRHDSSFWVVFKRMRRWIDARIRTIMKF